MTRKKAENDTSIAPAAAPPEPGHPDNVKYSIVVPWDVSQRVMLLASRQRLTISDICRQLLDRGSNEALGLTGTGAQPGVTVELTPAMQRALNQVAEMMSVTPSAIIQLLLSDHLSELFSRARATAERLKEALGPSYANRDPGSEQP